MEINSICKLTKDSRKFLLDEFKKKNLYCLIIDNIEIKNSLLNNNLIEANMDENYLCFKLTETGKRYCEGQIEIDNKSQKDNFIQWTSLCLSALAIILSIISLSIQFMNYLNDKTETTSARIEIIDEIIDNVITIDLGIE